MFETEIVFSMFTKKTKNSLFPFFIGIGVTKSLGEESVVFGRRRFTTLKGVQVQQTTKEIVAACGTNLPS